MHHEESKQAHEATLNKLKKSQLDVVEAQMSEEEKYTKSARSWEQEKIKLEKEDDGVPSTAISEISLFFTVAKIAIFGFCEFIKS